MKIAPALSLVFAAALVSSPLFAADASSQPGDNSAGSSTHARRRRAAGHAAGHEGSGSESAKMGGNQPPAGAQAPLRVRVKLNDAGAAGEFTCRDGHMDGNEVVFAHCVHSGLDKYDQIAVHKKFIEAGALAALPAKKKNLAKKLAFLDSAHEALTGEIRALPAAQRDTLDYKKAVGALNNVDKDLARAVADCSKEDPAVFHCPQAPEMPPASTTPGQSPAQPQH